MSLTFDGVNSTNFQESEPVIKDAIRNQLLIQQNEVQLSLIPLSSRRRLTEQDINARIKAYSEDQLNEVSDRIDSNFHIFFNLNELMLEYEAPCFKVGNMKLTDLYFFL